MPKSGNTSDSPGFLDRTSTIASLLTAGLPALAHRPSILLTPLLCGSLRLASKPAVSLCEQGETARGPLPQFREPRERSAATHQRPRWRDEVAVDHVADFAQLPNGLDDHVEHRGRVARRDSLVEIKVGRIPTRQGCTGGTPLAELGAAGEAFG